jgi:hypothetical protein
LNDDFVVVLWWLEFVRDEDCGGWSLLWWRLWWLEFVMVEMEDEKVC